MQIQSTVTGRYYTPAKCVYILNQKQTALYMKNGLDLLDIYVDGDKLVYVFDKKSSEPLYAKWKNYELA